MTTPTKVSLEYCSIQDHETKPASVMTYSGPAVDSGGKKASDSLALRQLIAVGKTELSYILNPYYDREVRTSDVRAARFTGTCTQNSNVWLPQGFGVITETKYKFTLYEGEFDGGFRHGFGKAPIFVLRSGSAEFDGVYRGQWERGHRHGFGELADSAAGTTYFGEWRFDRRHGRGEEVYADGSRYVGLWANGVRHGPGRLHMADGVIQARDHGGMPTVGKGSIGPATAIEAWLAEAKEKLAAMVMEQEASVPLTGASLSGLSGKAGLADRKKLTEFKEKELVQFSQQLASIVGQPVELVVETDTFLAGPESKVSVNLLVEGQSEFLLAPLLKAIATVCSDESARTTFGSCIRKIVVKNDPAVREVTHKLEDKAWTLAGNFADPSEVLVPNKIASWIEAKI